MGKLQNGLTAGAVYVTAIALLYGFTATVAKTSAHWGSGYAGRRAVDVMSDAPSLPGGTGRHGGFSAYTEKTTELGVSGIYGPRKGGGRVKTYTGAHRA
jgi:hypothetical protein